MTRRGHWGSPAGRLQRLQGMDNPNPDATADADPGQPDARKRRDAGLPTDDKEQTPREKNRKNIAGSQKNDPRYPND